MKRLELLGKSFGRLKVRKYHGVEKNTMWECKCICGTTTIVRGSHLTSGQVKSCGCLLNENGANFTIHNMSRAPEMRAYVNAKHLCTNCDYIGWKDYGGRGIKFLFTSFDQFYTEIGPRPKGLTLDRIDNDGNYEPGNVRWATRKQQQRNRRNTP